MPREQAGNHEADVPWPYFELRRPRPSTLSGSDFRPSEAEVRQLLDRDEAELDYRDYRELLCVVDAAGCYKESVYFLPFAFSRVLTHRDEALEIIAPLIDFVSAYEKNLASDGYLEMVRSALLRLLEAWTSEFNPNPEDEDRYVRGKHVESYVNHLRRVQVLVEALDHFNYHKAYVDIGEEFLRSLAKSLGDPAKASWFLSLAEPLNAGWASLITGGPLADLFRDEELLLSAATTVHEELKRLGRQSWYWEDMVFEVGLYDFYAQLVDK